MGKIISGAVKASTFGMLDPKLGETDTPKLPKVNVAPDPDSTEAAKAESRRLQRRKRTGRTSTVLGSGSTNLG